MMICSSFPGKGADFQVSVEERTEQREFLGEFDSEYQITVLNDNFTTMDFVVKILMDFFEKDFQQAYKIMMLIHQQGRAVVGVYSKEIAETKIHQVKMLAEQYEFPLHLIMEKI